MSVSTQFSSGRLGAARRTASRIWAPLKPLRTELGRSGTVGSSALMFPGLATRIGLRYALGRLLGSRVTHSRLSYEFGGDLQSSPPLSRGRRAATLLIPSVLLVLVGLAFGLPILLEMRLLGVNLVPTDLSSDAATEIVLQRLVVRGQSNAFALWCAMSAWYAAALSRSELKEVLEAVGREVGNRGAAAKAVSIALVPFRALTRVTDPLDRFFGIATGASSLLLWFVVTVGIARLLF